MSASSGRCIAGRFRNASNTAIFPEDDQKTKGGNSYKRGREKKTGVRAEDAIANI
jgi:hypothetical protein